MFDYKRRTRLSKDDIYEIIWNDSEEDEKNDINCTNLVMWDKYQNSDLIPLDFMCMAEA